MGQWTHGIGGVYSMGEQHHSDELTGLYGLFRFFQITGDKTALNICLNWFKVQFELGTTKVSDLLIRYSRNKQSALHRT